MIDYEFIALQEALAGDYSLERELGRGGMGVVYLAREVQLDRLVAIKVLPSALAERVDIREQFLREARTAASLSHPNIVPIYRVGERAGFVFFAMAYVKGETLGERLRSRGPLPAAAATRLLRDVAWALAYAHGRGIVHRDVKPDNILIEADTERALVSDFGIALGVEATDDAPSGRVMGTARFMSPEQAAGETVDGRSDLYSLGVVAYLALSGKLPVDSLSVSDAASQRVERRPAPLASVVSALPMPLSSVVDRCLAKLRDHRWDSGEALAEALERAMAPARIRIPMALRVWTRATDPLKPVYLAWSGMFGMGTISELHRGGDWLTTIAFGLAPLVPLTVFHARKTYQAFAAGYTLADLRQTLRAWQSERREEIAFEHGERDPKWMRALRLMSVTLATAFVGDMIWFTNGPHHGVLRQAIILAALGVSAVTTVAASSSLGVSFLPRRVRSGLVGAVRSAIWGSRLGDWAARLLTPRRRRALPDADFRPTEMALSVAAEELFAALPRAYREHLGDVPRVIRGLEIHASAARERVSQMTALLSLDVRTGHAHADPPETATLAAARDAAVRDLAASVAALETIRLDLLRLHGQGAAADLAPITTSLDAARRVGDELDALNSARREVERIVPHTPFDLTPATPV